MQGQAVRWDWWSWLAIVRTPRHGDHAGVAAVHHPTLEPRHGARCARYIDVALLDLDGVVYIGAHAVDGAVDALAERAGARACDWPSSRTTPPARPAVVAEHLTELGIPAADRRGRSPPPRPLRTYSPTGSRRGAGAVVGTAGLVRGADRTGSGPGHSADDDPAAVVQGYSPDLDCGASSPRAPSRSGAGCPGSPPTWTRPFRRPAARCPATARMVAALRHATGVTRSPPASPIRACTASPFSDRGPAPDRCRRPVSIPISRAPTPSAVPACWSSPESPTPAELLAARPAVRPDLSWPATWPACSTHTRLPRERG